MEQSDIPDSQAISRTNRPLMDDAFLQQLVNCLPMGSMIVNNDACILFVNETLAEILGYDCDELLGLDIDQLLPDDFRANHKQLMRAFFRQPRQRQMGVGQALYARRKEGDPIPIEIGLNPIVRDGQTLVLATLIDLTPRLRANKMFQRSIQDSPHGVLVVDANGMIRVTNTMLCDYFGYSAAELLNQPLDMLLPERYRQHHGDLRRSFHLNPSPRMMGVGRDLTALHKDGREFPVEIGLSPFEDEHNNDMVFVSLLDITQRKRMEQELRETNTRLEEFTYVASHDLRSPLRGIADLIEWIKEDIASENQADAMKNVGRIALRVQRMEQLIDNLLTYARAAKKDAKRQDVDLNLLLDNVTELLEMPDGMHITRDIQLTHFVSALTPLETVLRNLISNAIKHHDTKVGQIFIRSVADNNFCHLMVRDDGPGIPAAAHERIFRLFQTITASERSGTGIGLSVSRRLVESHGGRISVEANQPPPGVTFHVWWPRFLRTDNHD